MTVNAWETGRDEPKVSYLPAILAFLGYDPFTGEMGFGERLRTERRRRGLTQVKLARELGIATSTLQKLEAGGEVTEGRVVQAVRGFLEGRGVGR
jgi:hypothetical protein